jgi:predicted metal-binding membrane protein
VNAGSLRALPGVLATAAVVTYAWIFTVSRMNGMHMGPGQLGTFSFFVATWTAMMAAMMLPSAPVRRIRRLRVVAPFDAAYVAVWLLFGLTAYEAVRLVASANIAALAWHRDGAAVSGAVIVAAGLYELTPVKRRCLARCRSLEPAPLSGLRYGASCIGSSAGLMAVLFAVGVMSLGWMVAVAALILVEKAAFFGARIVPAAAIGLIGLGVWVAVAPASVPGLVPPM